MVGLYAPHFRVRVRVGVQDQCTYKGQYGVKGTTLIRVKCLCVPYIYECSTVSCGIAAAV